jgi:hypothetical protein
LRVLAYGWLSLVRERTDQTARPPRFYAILTESAKSSYAAHVDPVRALMQDLLAPGRDLRYPARRAVQQPGLSQMGNSPGDKYWRASGGRR